MEKFGLATMLSLLFFSPLYVWVLVDSICIPTKGAFPTDSYLVMRNEWFTLRILWSFC